MNVAVVVHYSNVSHWSILSILWSLGESPQIHTQAIECGHAPDTTCLKMIHHQNTEKKTLLLQSLQRPVMSGKFLSIHILLFPFLRFLSRVLCYSLMSMFNNNVCQFQMKFLTMQWIWVLVLDIFKNSSQSCFVLWHIAIVTIVTWAALLCHSHNPDNANQYFLKTNHAKEYRA